ncbi:solute carrier family 22 member 3-like [Cydia pomonella]|uniref:solute carrier family 22 member 3-like n=1 Tax=Cydia pomonella TaxID=82600 RepID=UPI002ADDFF66|nr:solute carrier family 22 member 3-like [Cydia pomonella]
MDLGAKNKSGTVINHVVNFQEVTSAKPKDVSTALQAVIKDVGDMGIYQRLLFVGMLPFGFLWAFVYMSHLFITATPYEHWCRVPELDGLGWELRRNLSIPTSAAGGFERCVVFDANWTEVLETLLPPAPGSPILPCQNGWEFLFDDIPYPTVSTEREWVCSRAALVPWSQTISILGSMLGGILLGYFADRFGRIPALLVSNVLGCAGGVAMTFTTGFWDFSMCRFLVGMSCDGCFLFIYILALEYVGVKHRSWVANMSIALYFGGGCVVLPWLALWFSDWKTFILVTSLPMLVALVTPFLVPESVGWLVSKGRVDEAVKIVHKFERVNKTKISQDVLDEFIAAAKSFTQQDESVFVIFKSKGLRRTLFFLVIAFMSCALVFDGLIRMSEHLGVDFFIAFTLTSATEVPSIALVVLLIDRFGRRKIVSLPLIIGGIVAFIGAFVPRGVASVVMAMGARFLGNMAYSAVIQWTPELMPTSVRASGASFVHVSGFAAAMLAPFLVYSVCNLGGSQVITLTPQSDAAVGCRGSAAIRPSASGCTFRAFALTWNAALTLNIIFPERVWGELPLVLVGATAVAGGTVALLLPETAGQPLPQTLDDYDRIADARRQ